MSTIALAIPNPTPTPSILNRYQQELPDLLKLDSERKMEHRKFVLDPLIGKKEMIDFTNHFYLNNKPINLNEADRIPFKAFIQLFNEAIGIGVNLNSTSYLSGIRMHYGVRINKKGEFELALIYQPVYANYIKNNQFEIIEGTQKKFYLFNGLTFITIPTLIAEDYIRYYSEFIRIKHRDDAQPTQHRGKDFPEDERDTTSSTFMFQELFTLMHDNYQDTNDPIIICHSMLITEESIPKNRHSLILMPDYITAQKRAAYFGDYTYKYANRAYLCPPDCTNIEIDF